MVNPPNTPVSAARPEDVRLAASSTDTLRFLANRVGELVEARVVKVSTLNPGALNPVTAGSTAQPGASATSTAAPTNTAVNQAVNPALNAAAANAARASAVAEGAINAAYEVLLKVGNQQLAVKSELAPRLGQVLQLQVESSQQLRVVELIAAATSRGQATIAATSGASQSTNVAPTTTAAATQLTAQQALTGTGLQTQALLESALRNDLPRQTPRPQLLAQLQTLLNSAAPAGSVLKPSGDTQSTGNPATVSPTLNTVANATTNALNNAGLATSSLAQLQLATQALVASIKPLNGVLSAEGLQQAIQNSGAFYERKIAQLAVNSPNYTTARASESALPLPTALQRGALNQGIITGLYNAAQNTSRTINNAAVYNSTTATEQQNATLAAAVRQLTSVARDGAANIDNKLALLTVISAVKQLLAAPSSATETKSHPALADNATLSLLWQVLPQSLGTALPANNTQQNDDAVLQLLRMLLGTVARTQSQQLMALNTQFAAGNDNSINQSLSMELPLWVDQKLQLIDLQIEREPANQAAAQEQPRVWNARLEFDLDSYGKLTALATLREKTLAAVLWATEPGTADRIQAELPDVAANLDRMGLNVQNLQIRLGEPEEISSSETINLLDTEI